MSQPSPRRSEPSFCGFVISATLAALSTPQAQADPRAISVNFQNLEGICLADLHRVLGLFDSTFGQFGNMHQAVFADANINKHAKLGDADNGAFDIIADP